MIKASAGRVGYSSKCSFMWYYSLMVHQSSNKSLVLLFSMHVESSARKIPHSKHPDSLFDCQGEQVVA